MALAGSTIGRYQLLRLLAAGGMGEIFLARQLSTIEGFGSLAAIKLLLPSLSADAQFVRMFLEEARVVGTLHHRNIVQIRDVNEHAGRYYMVMEYIPGQNLRELLGDLSIPDKSLFEPRLGAEVFTDMASALSAAHAGGLIHRDVSPNNIMIGDEGIAKLIDFGIARAVGQISATTPGTVKGKFGYMAPEYVRRERYDHRVDLFSLGVVMWETFARRRLFRGSTAAEQLHQLMEAEIPSLATIVPDFPPKLAAVVAELLERDPADRISTAAEAAERLAEIVSELPHGPDLTLRRWIERRIPGRIEDRRTTDQMLLSLPADRAIPDFGPSYPDAGSVPGTYGFREAPGYRTGTGQTQSERPLAPTLLADAPPMMQFPAPAPAPAPSSRRAWIVAAAAIVVAAVAITWIVRGQSTSGTSAPAAPTAAASGSATTASGAPGASVTLVEAHRQIGLKAMADGDYAKAIAEYTEAIAQGGGGDLPDLLAYARQLGEAGTGAGSAAGAGSATEVAIGAGSATVEPPATSSGPAPVRVATAVRDRTASPGRGRDKDRDKDRRTGRPGGRDESTSLQQSVTKPSTGELMVTAIAASAAITVDDSPMGTAPKLLTLSPGSHKVSVRASDQTIYSGTVTIVAGETGKLFVETVPAKPVDKPVDVAKNPPPPPPPPPQVDARPAPRPTPRVTATGDPAVGARVVGECNSCHAKSGAGAVSGRRYTKAMWDRFFAAGQHDRYLPLGDVMSASRLAAAKAYLRANAADAPEDQGAGVREE